MKNDKNLFCFFICDSKYNIDSNVPLFIIDKPLSNSLIELAISSTHAMYNASIKHHKHPLIVSHLNELNTTNGIIKEKICKTLQNLNL